MRLPGDEVIDEAMRQLVREKVLTGWRTYAWRQQMWTVCPRGERSRDLSRYDAQVYVGLRA